MSHLGPNGGNPHSGTNNRPQDPDVQTCPHPRNLSAHPVFYVHAPPPPPPPVFHYPWPRPMPFLYNPLEGFPGMGCGLVMPPFPPFMETPAYFMHHPQVQPMDYRRLLPPQVHAPTAPQQTSNQTRSIRPPRSGTTQTGDCAVQTEPTEGSAGEYRDGSPQVRSDSGHGTTSVSPSSSSSPRRGDAVEDHREILNESLGSISNIQRSWGSGTPQAAVSHMADKMLPSSPSDHDKPAEQSSGEAESREGVGERPEMPSRRTFNESLWSVESLLPFVPTKEWLAQNGLLDPDVIDEMVEEVENGQLAQDVKIVNGGKLLVQAKGPSPEKEAAVLNPPTGEEVGQGADVEAERGACEQLCVPAAGGASPRGRLVDCGVQCDRLSQMKCLCEDIRSIMKTRVQSRLHDVTRSAAEQKTW